MYRGGRPYMPSSLWSMPGIWKNAVAQRGEPALITFCCCHPALPQPVQILHPLRRKPVQKTALLRVQILHP